MCRQSTEAKLMTATEQKEPHHPSAIKWINTSHWVQAAQYCINRMLNCKQINESCLQKYCSSYQHNAQKRSRAQNTHIEQNVIHI